MPQFDQRWDIQASPGWNGFDVVPSDTADLKSQAAPNVGNVARSLFVGTGGDVAFIPGGCEDKYVTHSTGTYVVSGASTHAIHAVIDGEDSTATTTGTDAQCATALADAINVNSALDGIATAAINPDAPTHIIVTAVPPGKVGNFGTTASGTGLTASQSALAGGTGVRVWKNLPDAFVIPMWVRRVLDTGTTADDIEGIV